MICTKRLKEAVIHLVSHKTSVQNIAKRSQVTRKTLYDWKQELVGEELPSNMSKIPNSPNLEDLKDEVIVLKRQVYQLRMEKDFLERSTDLIKKHEGINPLNLSNKEKTIVIDTLLQYYPLIKFLIELKLPKSSYHYHRILLRLPEKYAELKNRKIIVSEKVIRRLVEKEKLIVKSVSKKKHNSYAGEITPATPNIIQRNFKAKVPNEKWLIDITKFSVYSGKVYLSPIIDCFDGAAVS
ncbi:transposase [Alkalibacterium sp. 20]|uniref:transposase n=1 Tax=Alkalibacterium sp. 20 TaxID=1798803 RepID=UPI00091B04A8|nr:hypothetical protein AX762_09765 [Alkalibacterium sp. 20]